MELLNDSAVNFKLKIEFKKLTFSRRENKEKNCVLSSSPLLTSLRIYSISSLQSGSSILDHQRQWWSLGIVFCQTSGSNWSRHLSRFGVSPSPSLGRIKRSIQVFSSLLDPGRSGMFYPYSYIFFVTFPTAFFIFSSLSQLLSLFYILIFIGRKV